MGQKFLAIHIGYHKTGTTWLQKCIFPSLPGLNYIEKRYDKNIWGGMNFNRKMFNIGRKANICEDAVRGIGCKADDDFDDVLCGDIIKKSLHKERPNLISHEALCKPFLRDKVPGRIDAIFQGEKVKIIVSIRRQRDLIFSRYTHDVGIMKKFYYLTDALDYNSERFCNYPACHRGENECFCDQRGQKTIQVEHYDYYKLLQLYLQYFDKENILFLVNERMRLDPCGELGRLYDFMGIKIDDQTANRISSKEGVNVRSIREKQELFNANKDIEKTLSELDEYFKRSNKKLDAILSLGLKEYKYY